MGRFSGRDGAGCAVVGAVRADRAVLSEAGQWPYAGGLERMLRIYVLAAVIQSVGPGGGGGAVRFAGDGVSRTH